ncbi:glycosyltransferase family 2 protein [Thermococcus sp. M39]|uniref:glycosyltransferase n=1 Tax=unclassified Thermococcus TaxID=2627626 RepID=UPI001439F208|nr:MULTISPECIES: glycosyltransferase family 2 protein [unclassified Thermococcus]NJE07800.1 glycosyltransferase family 2 protein [Thermococcus sp. M39]NJE12354.1 glycosyltransferase family 2 protein [Thermococcus sp. LS2]
MLLETALLIIIFWDLYFFLNYIISLLRNYRIKEWAPFVSIIIPAYNEEKNIKDSVKSAISQDYPNFEVIVVDDGSEDKTFEVASSIKDERLKVFRKPHEGKARALNFGLSKAQGEIIVTTDADTLLHNSAVKELVKRFYDESVLGVGGQVRVLASSFLERAQDVEHLRIAMFRRAKELEDLSVAPGPISAFRKEALEKIGGFVESRVEDYATTKEIKKLGRVVYASKAKAYTKMPTSLKTLWNQRKRWFLGDLMHLGGGFLKEGFFLILGDFIAFLDVIVPILLIVYGNWLLLGAFLSFEIITMMVPTLIEGGSIINALLFPAFLWFWALFYLALHIYGYLYILKSKAL